MDGSRDSNVTILADECCSFGFLAEVLWLDRRLFNFTMT
jgi:hypothetical protein